MNRRPKFPSTSGLGTMEFVCHPISEIGYCLFDNPQSQHKFNFILIVTLNRPKSPSTPGLGSGEPEICLAPQSEIGFCLLLSKTSISSSSPSLTTGLVTQETFHGVFSKFFPIGGEIISFVCHLNVFLVFTKLRVGWVFTRCNFIPIRTIQTAFLKSTLPIFLDYFTICFIKHITLFLQNCIFICYGFEGAMIPS